jgi:hypothetical protein
VRTQAAALIKQETGQAVDPSAIFFESTRATEEALTRGGWTAGHVPPYAIYWLGKDAQGTERYQTIPGRLFQADIVAAREAENARVRTERQRAIDAGTPPPIEPLTGPRATAPERRDDAADRRIQLLDMLGFSAPSATDSMTGR